MRVWQWHRVQATNRVVWRSRQYSHNQVKLIKQKATTMHAAYFRHQGGQENYDLTFILNNSSLGINRQFNFTRQSTETVGNLLGRITANVDKYTQKKRKKKLKSEDSEEKERERCVDVQLVQNGKTVPVDKLCLEIMKGQLRTQLLIVDSVFDIVINAPWITNLALPMSILAGFPIYPTKFEGYFVNKKHCKFLWYAALVNEKTNIQTVAWTQVGEGYMYFSKITDIGKRLKVVCFPGNGSQTGPEVETMAERNVEAGPGFCPFENRHAFTTELTSGNIFRVLSYNILADLYCDSDFSRTCLYPHCPPYALHMDYRKQLIVKEILGYNSDVICLQEVDTKVFDADLLPLLDEHNFQGVFSKKAGQVAEGLACFYKATKFSLIKNVTLTLADDIESSPLFEDMWGMISNNQAFVSRLKDRTTVAQCVVLNSLDNDNRIVVVGNTHLYFHPDADHVRLIQGGLVIRWLNDLVSQLQEQVPQKTVSLVLCGDFNSVPSCGIYQLYTSGVAPTDLEDWKSNEIEALNDVSLTQPRLLSSACGAPLYTNYTVGFADCLDYIFHDSSLKTVQMIPFPSIEELKQHTALPSVVFPSDHIALVADLQFC